MPWKTTRRPSGPGGQGRDLSIDLLGAAPATAIKNSAPVITTLLAALLYGEQVTPLRWAAVVAIVAGIALVSWRPGSGVRQWLGPGALYAVGAALSYGVRPLFLKFGLDAANIPLTAACIGAFAALVYALAMGDRSELRAITQANAFWLFVAAGALQAIGFLALNFGLSGGDVRSSIR
jgi:drug/metabolite transporter (DMT)-like permease